MTESLPLSELYLCPLPTLAEAAFRASVCPNRGSPGTRGKELACTKLSDVRVPPFLIFEMGGPWGGICFELF